MTAQHLNNATTTPDFFREFQKVVYKIKQQVSFLKTASSLKVYIVHTTKYVGKQM